MYHIERDTHLGQLITDARLARGMTQRELAAIIGMTPQALHRIEAGRMVLTKPETIMAFADALDLDPDDLSVASNRVPADLALILSINREAVRTARAALGLA